MPSCSRTSPCAAAPRSLAGRSVVDMDLVFEIGTEELPASFQKPALEWMAAEINKALDDARLNGEGEAQRANISAFATPRRLALIVTAIAQRAPDIRKKLSGPPAKQAKQDGKWTKAAEGFARKARVLADWAERSLRISEEVARAAREAGGVPRPDPELLETVTGLVEEPFGVAGYFEKEFLQLPPEVLVSEMRGHQKYFAVQNEKGELLPAFVAISNTKVRDPAVSRRGYERVLRARLSDGKFFFDEDRKVPLRSRLEKLGRRTFLQGLGTELERVQRLRELSLWLHGATGRGDPRQLAEAAELCKADLTTGMVGEFPELQGAMGRVYALHEGVEPAVADAIFEHYLPRGAEDRLPSGDVGALLGIADRLDLLAGLFGLGKEPTGTADPFGLRRAALGILRVTLARGYRFDLDER